MKKTVLEEANNLQWRAKMLADAIKDCDNPTESTAVIGGESRVPTLTITVCLPSSFGPAIKAVIEEQLLAVQQQFDNL